MTLERANGRPRLAVALTFPVHPPLGGGQVRVYQLYRHLARAYDVEIVSLGQTGEPAGRFELAPGLWEHRVRKSVEHGTREMELERDVGAVVTDVAMGRLHRHTPDYAVALRAASIGAEAVVASHPYSYQAIRDATDVPLCYEAHNVEATLKAEMLTRGDAGIALLAEVAATEAACCREAALTWTCSEEDRDELLRRYGPSRERLVVVPNGVALDETTYTCPSVRREHRRRLRTLDRQVAVFIASWHQPNVAAAQRVVELAIQRPELDFLIVGSVGYALADHSLPDNVQLAGTVSAEFKQAVLSIADVALNPVTTGSGTNIKMLDYFASGTPVISTTFGARGLGVEPGEHYVQGESHEFGDALDRLNGLDIGVLDSLTGAARAHVEAQLSWPAIAEGLRDRLGQTFSPLHAG